MVYWLVESSVVLPNYLITVTFSSEDVTLHKGNLYAVVYVLRLGLELERIGMIPLAMDVPRETMWINSVKIVSGQSEKVVIWVGNKRWPLKLVSHDKGRYVIDTEEVEDAMYDL